MARFSFARLTALGGFVFGIFLFSATCFAQTQTYDASGAAGLAVRMNTLEDQVRQLNGQVEQLSYQIRQLQDLVTRMSQDTEYRFQSMGQGGGQNTPQRSSAMQAPAQTEPPPITIISPSGQTLGTIPGRPLDLASALGQPLPDSRYPQQPTLGTGPGGTMAAPSQNSQLALAPSGDPKDIYDLSYGYILRGEFDLAEASFRDFLVQYPNDPLAGNAVYWLGESLFARGMYRDAADAFLKGYSEYPDGAKAPDSLYKLGMSLKELGQAEAACSTFTEIGRRYPHAPQAVLERTHSELQKIGC
jgi:tol-pal system protein YbgF